MKARREKGTECGKSFSLKSTAALHSDFEVAAHMLVNFRWSVAIHKVSHCSGSSAVVRGEMVDEIIVIEVILLGRHHDILACVVGLNPVSVEEATYGTKVL